MNTTDCLTCLTKMLLVVCFLICLSLHVGYGDPIYQPPLPYPLPISHPRRPYPFSRPKSKPPSLLTELRDAIDDLVGDFLPETQ